MQTDQVIILKLKVILMELQEQHFLVVLLQKTDLLLEHTKL
jgi:hypothetical protein